MHTAACRNRVYLSHRRLHPFTRLSSAFSSKSLSRLYPPRQHIRSSLYPDRFSFFLTFSVVSPPLSLFPSSVIFLVLPYYCRLYLSSTNIDPASFRCLSDRDCILLHSHQLCWLIPHKFLTHCAAVGVNEGQFGPEYPSSDLILILFSPWRELLGHLDHGALETKCRPRGQLSDIALPPAPTQHRRHAFEGIRQV